MDRGAARIPHAQRAADRLAINRVAAGHGRTGSDGHPRAGASPVAAGVVTGIIAAAAAITDAEFSTLTGGTGERGITFDTPPRVSPRAGREDGARPVPGRRPPHLERPGRLR